MLASNSHRMRTFLIAVALLAAACGKQETRLSVADVLADPGRFEGRTLEFEGRVVDATGLFSVGVYKFDDGSGEINVLTSGGLPAVDSSFTLRGEVLGGVTLGGSRYGVSIRESERIYPEPKGR